MPNRLLCSGSLIRFRAGGFPVRGVPPSPSPLGVFGRKWLRIIGLQPTRVRNPCIERAYAQNSQNQRLRAVLLQLGAPGWACSSVFIEATHIRVKSPAAHSQGDCFSGLASGAAHSLQRVPGPQFRSSSMPINRVATSAIFYANWMVAKSAMAARTLGDLHKGGGLTRITRALRTSCRSPYSKNNAAFGRL